jgi:hypothetical protein
MALQPRALAQPGVAAVKVVSIVVRENARGRLELRLVQDRDDLEPTELEKIGAESLTEGLLMLLEESGAVRWPQPETVQ